jgi:hypothetical protein
MTVEKNKPGGAFFPVLFALISLMFIGIMLYAYHGAREANPVMLDEQGHVRAR